MATGDIAAKDDQRVSDPAPDTTEPTDALYEWLAGKRTFSALIARRPFLNYWWQAAKKPDNLPIHLTWIFTALLALFAFTAWQDSQESSRKASKQLDLLANQQRPWLNITETKLVNIVTHGPPDKLEGELYFRFVVRNVGKSPAIGPEIRFQVITGKKKVIFKDKEREEYTTVFDDSDGDISSNQCERDYYRSEKIGTIFPGSDETHDIYIVDKQMKLFEYAFMELTSAAMVIACVAYRSPTDDKLHMTRQVYELFGKAVDGRYGFDADHAVLSPVSSRVGDIY